MDIEPEAFQPVTSRMGTDSPVVRKLVSNTALLPPDTFLVAVPVADILAHRVDRAAAGMVDMVAAGAGIVVGSADLSIREIGLCQAILPELAASMIPGLPT